MYTIVCRANKCFISWLDENRTGSMTTINVAFINKRVLKRNYFPAYLYLNDDHVNVVVRYASASARAE